MRHTSSPFIVFIILVAILLVYGFGTLFARKRGYSGIGGNTIVRCRDGHLFTTLWVPGVSFKSIRLGSMRFQRCPIGKNFTLVTPVNESELTEQEKRLAREHKDNRIP
jgi:hypothetical protein